MTAGLWAVEDVTFTLARNPGNKTFSSATTR